MKRLALLCLVVLQVNPGRAANLALTFDQGGITNGGTGTFQLTGQIAADATGYGGSTYGDIGFVYDYHSFGSQFSLPEGSNLPGNFWISFGGFNSSGTATFDSTTYAIHNIGIWLLVYPDMNIATLNVYLAPDPVPSFNYQLFDVNLTGNFQVSSVLGTDLASFGGATQALQGTYNNQINNSPERALVISVPEPSAVSLVAVGFAGGVALRRCRRSAD